MTLLEMGADDYITKPFSPREFLARLRVALRHYSPPSGLTSDSLSAPFFGCSGKFFVAIVQKNRVMSFDQVSAIV